MSVKKESTLLEDLNQALAGETLAAFRYLYLSKIANGINSAHLSSTFQEIAKEEWAHASTLMGRIIQIGGVSLSSRSPSSEAHNRKVNFSSPILLSLPGATLQLDLVLQ